MFMERIELIALLEYLNTGVYTMHKYYCPNVPTLLMVILINFNELVLKMTQIIMMMAMCFILNWQDVTIHVVSIFSCNNMQQ